MEELSNLTFFNKQICQLTGEDNFQLWKQQVLLEVRGFNLEGYLFDTLHVPHMIDYGEGNKVLNSKYVGFNLFLYQQSIGRMYACYVYLNEAPSILLFLINHSHNESV